MSVKFLFNNVIKEYPISVQVASMASAGSVTAGAIDPTSGSVITQSISISVYPSSTVTGFPLDNVKSYTRGEYAKIRQTYTGVTQTSWTAMQIEFLEAERGMNTLVIGPSNLDSANDEVIVQFLDATLTPLILDYHLSSKHFAKELLINAYKLEDFVPIIPFGELLWGIDPLEGIFTNSFNLPIWLNALYKHNAGVFTQASPKYIKIFLRKSVNPSLPTYSGVVDYNISYIMAGMSVQTDRGAAPGLGIGYQDTYESYRTEDGSLRTTPGIRFKKYKMSLSNFSEKDRSLLLRYINKRNAFLFSVFQQTDSIVSQMQAIDYTALVKPTNNLDITTQYFGYYNASVELEEV